MTIVLDVLNKVVDLGAFVMMPVILFVMGMIFRMKPSDALRAGITVGIGFKGISLAAGLITETMTFVRRCGSWCACRIYDVV